ncbi:hypothetical protein MIDIC_510046 [Alphaproteobacteria bacterium]
MSGQQDDFIKNDDQSTKRNVNSNDYLSWLFDSTEEKTNKIDDVEDVQPLQKVKAEKIAKTKCDEIVEGQTYVTNNIKATIIQDDSVSVLSTKQLAIYYFAGSIILVSILSFGIYIMYDKWRNHRDAEHIVLTPLFFKDRLLIDTNDKKNSTKMLLEYGYVDPNISRLMYSFVKKGDVVIDVGAGFGYYTMYLSHLVGNEGTVHSFEANKNKFSLLENSVLINHLKNIHAYNKLLFSTSARILLEMHEEAEGKSGSMSIFLDHSVLTHAPHLVTTYAETIDSVLPNLSNVKLLHINAKSSELSILLGASNLIAKSPNIKIITSWNKQLMQKYANIKQFVAQCLQLGFKFWLLDHTSGELRELNQLETIMAVDDGVFVVAKSYR